MAIETIQIKFANMGIIDELRPVNSRWVWVQSDGSYVEDDPFDSLTIFPGKLGLLLPDDQLVVEGEYVIHCPDDGGLLPMAKL